MAKESKIILIQDLLNQKQRKERELAYYRERMEEYQVKLDILQREIRLTEKILKMIEKDKITDITNA